MMNFLNKKKNRITNSSAIFKPQDGSDSPPGVPGKQPTKVMQNLVTAEAPGEQTLNPDWETAEIRPDDLLQANLKTAPRFAMPQANATIIDNALAYAQSGGSVNDMPNVQSFSQPQQVQELVALEPEVVGPQFPTTYSLPQAFLQYEANNIGQGPVFENFTVPERPAPKVKPERQSFDIPSIEELNAIAEEAVRTCPDLMARLAKWKANSDFSQVLDPERGHADHAISSAEREYNCQASVPLSYIVGENKTSVQAEEGTLAHNVAEECVNARLEGRGYLELRDYVDPYKPEMLTHGRQYAEQIYGRVEPYLKYPHTWFTEQKVCVDAQRDSWGSADFIFAARVGKFLHVYNPDYKYGKGVTVESENEETGMKNWQIMLYTFASMLKVTNLEKGLIAAVAIGEVIQPRVDTTAPPIIITIKEALDYADAYVAKVDIAENFVVQIQQAQERGEVVYTEPFEKAQNPGKWCQFCNGKTLCKAYASQKGVTKGLAMFKKAQEAGIVKRGAKEVAKQCFEQGIFTAEEVSFLALNASKIVAFVEDFPKTTMGLIERGEQIPNCVIEKTPGSRRWLDNPAEVIDGLKNLGIAQPTKVVESIIGIGEVEDIIGVNKIAHLTQQTPGVKLVEASKSKTPANVGQQGVAALYKKFVNKEVTA